MRVKSATHSHDLEELGGRGVSTVGAAEKSSGNRMEKNCTLPKRPRTQSPRVHHLRIRTPKELSTGQNALRTPERMNCRELEKFPEQKREIRL